jgi:general secretion pathway protein J
MRSQRGFTLLEIIVAIGIFAVLWMLAFGGWSSVSKSRVETERHARRLNELETAMTFLARDLGEAADRPVRDELGTLKPAFQGGAGSSYPLELTRAGWRNPQGQPRSVLQRVAWGVTDGVLVRHDWSVLDRVQDSQPLDGKVLTGVRELKVRFMHPNHEWVEDWPPASGGVGLPPATLPLAVELTIELEDLGTVGRVIRVPG